MSSWISGIPPRGEFFPPTPRVSNFLMNFYRLWPIGFCLRHYGLGTENTLKRRAIADQAYSQLSILQWTPLSSFQAMGKTSSNSRFNIHGRLAWTIAESAGPLNLLYILYTLPGKLKPTPDASTSFMGTGLPAQYEILACLYLVHYVNRAFYTPLFVAASMSPIHPIIVIIMGLHQYVNSSNIACGLVYSALRDEVQGYDRQLFSYGSVLGTIIGLAFFSEGLWRNMSAEAILHNMRRDAAKRKARSEGKIEVSYDKVYVIPPPQGYFRNILCPHYVWEWIEWTGYYILGGTWGLGWGWQSPALWFVVVEVATMLPRAVTQRNWYMEKFGKRAVAGRAAAIPGVL
ncbi:hypothetical protein PV08_04417 [Exophiala spinifera]|uniref:3-oxo-5-alpha-steroid 4-dehydrogenase C-terminal domain-containing protein n=1 Tax=Exophiala spinifera TaxID=91928 RepID=A0A0D1YPS8_9EURO|nr:uncharacterized protein PV08_04417 [Exophiala spinifera]KIW17226.1 hypothetical protein PV08_04417 [Exophiala spinifera]